MRINNSSKIVIGAFSHIDYSVENYKFIHDKKHTTIKKSIRKLLQNMN